MTSQIIKGAGAAASGLVSAASLSNLAFFKIPLAVQTFAFGPPGKPLWVKVDAVVHDARFARSGANVGAITEGDSAPAKLAATVAVESLSTTLRARTSLAKVTAATPRDLDGSLDLPVLSDFRNGRMSVRQFNFMAANIPMLVQLAGLLMGNEAARIFASGSAISAVTRATDTQIAEDVLTLPERSLNPGPRLSQLVNFAGPEHLREDVPKRYRDFVVTAISQADGAVTKAQALQTLRDLAGANIVTEQSVLGAAAGTVKVSQELRQAFPDIFPPHAPIGWADAFFSEPPLRASMAAKDASIRKDTLKLFRNQCNLMISEAEAQQAWTDGRAEAAQQAECAGEFTRSGQEQVARDIVRQSLERSASDLA